MRRGHHPTVEQRQRFGPRWAHRPSSCCPQWSHWGTAESDFPVRHGLKNEWCVRCSAVSTLWCWYSWLLNRFLCHHSFVISSFGESFIWGHFKRESSTNLLNETKMGCPTLSFRVFETTEPFVFTVPLYIGPPPTHAHTHKATHYPFSFVFLSIRWWTSFWLREPTLTRLIRRTAGRCTGQLSWVRDGDGLHHRYIISHAFVSWK